jgi:hypothetical protein
MPLSLAITYSSIVNFRYCPNFEKAFPISTKGTVLGINFYSENLSWYLPGIHGNYCVT